MKFGLLCFLLWCGAGSFGQVTITGSTGANATYSTLGNASGAFAALNAAGSQAGNNITITITANITTEAGTNNLNGNGWTSLKIVPQGNRTVSGSGGVDIIELNGCSNVTIDGLNDGTNSLTISNASTNSLAYALTLNNLSTNNLITNCTLTGSNAGSTGAVVFFNNNVTGVGTSSNIIRSCIITAASTSLLPTNGIYSNGNSNGKNQNNVIVSCRISDYFLATTGSAGIRLFVNNNAWRIDSCRFFQTATRTTTASGGPIHSAINLNGCTGDNFIISNNYIGGSDATGAGYTTYTGSGLGLTHYYKAIIVANNGPTIAALPSSTKVFNNTIRGINVISSATSAVAGNNIFLGIELSNGTTTDSVICRNNVIGGRTGTDSILISAAATGINNPCVGILNRSTKGNVIDSNIIGAVQFQSGSGARTTSFVGIKCESATTGDPTQIRYNRIGNNDVSNSFFSPHSVGQLIGIQYGAASSSAIVNVIGNTIQSFFTNAIHNGTGSGANIIGILGTSSNNDNITVGGNTIQSFRSVPIAPASVSIIGVRFLAQTGGLAVPGHLYGNNINNFSMGSQASATSKIIGLQSVVGNNHYIYNNMVAVGSGTNTGEVYAYECAGGTVRLYNNTFVVYGTSGTISAAFLRSNNNPFSAINNIFQNSILATNNSAVRFTSALSTTFSYAGNNNIFTPSATSNTAYINGILHTTLADFATALAMSSGNSEGANSKSATITFTSFTDLHTTDFDVIRAGQNLYTATPAITIDIDGQNRNSTCLPSVGADEVFFQTIGNRHTWVGTTDFKWCEPCNWDKATVPTNITSVYVPAGAANYPALNAADGCTITECDSITLSHNITPLRLGTSSNLQVYGSFYYTPTGGFSTYLGGLLTLKGTGNEEFKTTTIGQSFGFSNINVNRTDITTMNDCNLGVSNTLTLTNGIITLTPNMFISTQGIAGGSSTSYIATPASTNYLRLFNLTNNPNVLIPIGPNITSYNPLILNNQPANKQFDFTVNTGINPAVSFPLNAINRTWKIVPSAPVPSTPIDVTFQYADIDANASCNPTATMELGGYAPSVWNVVSAPYTNTPIGTATARQVTFPVTNWVQAYAIGNIGSILSVSNAINLQVAKNNQGAMLAWHINLLNDVQSFTIEKSIDGIQFMPLQTIPVNAFNNYTYQHLFTQTGTIFYRIKANKMLGAPLYSAVRVIMVKAVVSAKLIPSIVKNSTTLYINNKEAKNTQLLIVDADGKIIITIPTALTVGSQQIDIDVSPLPAGMYIIIIENTLLKFVKL